MTDGKLTGEASQVIAFILFLAGCCVGAALSFGWAGTNDWQGASRGLAWVVVTLSIFVSLNLWLTGRRDQRSDAILRLDWFLPALRRMPQGDSLGANPAKSWLGRLLRRVLPAGLQSNWQTKKRGVGRKWLRKLGLSWVASPARRLTQAGCLGVFCVLFFYVCWPYDAKPQNRQSYGQFRFASYDQAADLASFSPAGATFGNESSLGDFSAIAGRGAALWLYSGSGEAEGNFRVLGQFLVVESDADSLRLRPTGELSPMLLDLITGVSAEGLFDASTSDPNAWPSHYADNLTRKEIVPAETFLVIDPLVSLSTAIASRSWVWSLICAVAILLVCVVIPRGFCGYLCPLGTTIDLFDWAIAGRVKRFNVPDEGWWVHIKYYLLTGILLAAIGGILISGFFSAIPVLTRGMLFLVDPVQSGVGRGWHLLPGFNAGHGLSIALFLGVLGLGFLRPRFWCKYVCPSGAVFSVGNLFRVTERKVESSCIHCNKCVEICPFDAIKPDFTTRETDCTLCQSCAGVCPTHAIKFVERNNLVQLKLNNDPPTQETALGRRGFLSLAAGTAASAAGAAGTVLAGKAFGAHLDSPDAYLPVRPPGSVPEKEFLEMCIRCGECFKACPNNVLQPEAFEQGFEGLWTPMVQADWAGCESSCNACGQVCPTGAIRALALEEKRHARMGLAVINQETCLPLAGREECDLCVQECNAAGYRAIEYSQVGVETDADGRPVEGTGFTAPVVLPDLCVGCGLCQTRCYAINVKETHKLSESAIIIEAGEGKEDRIMSGSYRELHQLRVGDAGVVANEAEVGKETTSSASNATSPVSDPDEDSPF